MHYFIRSLNEPELTTLAMRTIEDCRKKFENDTEIDAIWQRMTKNLFDSKIKLNEFSKITFTAAINQLSEPDTLSQDSTKNVVDKKVLTK